jgi:hypothetical protein
MSKHAAWVAGASLLAVTGPAQAQKVEPERLRVFCAGVTKDGFQSPDVRDSVRDLRGALRGKQKTLYLVDGPEGADVVVVVEGRERVGSDRTVYAKLLVGAVEEPLRGSDDLFWSLAADEVAGQVDRWLKANRAQLMARRDQPQAAGSRPH